MQVKVFLKKIINFLILFGIEFDVPICGSITLRKIALLILIISFFSKKRFFIKKRFLMAFVGVCVFAIYVMLLLSIVQMDAQLSSNILYSYKEPIFLFLLLLFFPFLLSSFYDNVCEFVKYQWLVLLFQSCIVLIGRLFLPIRMYFFLNYSYGDGRLTEGVVNGVRSVGVDLSGAAGSMVLFVGIICGIYLYYASNKKKEKIRIMFGCMIVIAAMLFVGRTGLYFGIVILLLVIVDGIRKKDISVMYFIIFGMVLLSLIVIYVSISPTSWGVEKWLKWITEIKYLFSEGSTIYTLKEMNIPTLDWDTFWGTGILYGETSNGVLLNHDSGYIRYYGAVGVVGTILFYGIIYVFLTSCIRKVNDKTNKIIYFLFLVSIVVGEFKEPFLLKTPLLVIFCSILFLENKKIV